MTFWKRTFLEANSQATSDSCESSPSFAAAKTRQNTTKITRPKLVGGEALDRPKLWRYCQTAVFNTRHRAKKIGVPHTIDAHYVDALLIDQDFRCAVSGIVLHVSGDRFGGAFGPSLDRIAPALGYVPGNLRVVCQIANVAMNEWGLEALQKLMAAMAERTA